MGVGNLRDLLDERPPGKSITVPKSEMAKLPAGFSPTPLGTPLWIAKPGSMAQYRGPGGLHAYEFETWFDVHRDRHDPREEPFLHVLFEAGEIIAAIVAAVVAGFTTWVAMERREREKPERERSWLFPVLAALGVALFAGIVVYGLGSLARVALGSG